MSSTYNTILNCKVANYCDVDHDLWNTGSRDVLRDKILYVHFSYALMSPLMDEPIILYYNGNRYFTM